MEIEKRLLEMEEMFDRKKRCLKKLELVNEEIIYIKNKKVELFQHLQDVGYTIKPIEQEAIVSLWYELFSTKGKGVSKRIYDYKIYFELDVFTNKELVELTHKMKQYDGIQDEYQQLIQEQKDLVLEKEQQEFEALKAYYTELIKYKNHLRDLNESIIIGKNLLAIFNYSLELIQKAKSYDKLDIFGRGIFLTITKTELFKQVDDKIKNLHYLSHKFLRELNGIHFYMDLKMNIFEWKNWVDYLMKDLYFDLSDESKMNHILEMINKGKAIIEQLLDDLTLYKEQYLHQVLELGKTKNASI